MSDAASESQLLHAPGRPTGWGNLGLWAEGSDDYAQAAAALADAVGEAAAIGRGDHVLSLGCGAGEELVHWVRRFDAAAVVGIERESDLVHAAHETAARAGLKPPRVLVLGQSGLPDHAAFAPEAFDAVVAVDAAYHFNPRLNMLMSAQASLRPGGRLAYTDLVVEGGLSRLLRLVARVCGIDGGELLSLAQQAQRLHELGFVDVQARRLDDEVLGGFARFVGVQRQRLGERARGSAWRRVAVTAALIPPCRGAGLGYALLSARVPENAPIASTTALADATALSSSGTPGAA